MSVLKLILDLIWNMIYLMQKHASDNFVFIFAFLQGKFLITNKIAGMPLK